MKSRLEQIIDQLDDLNCHEQVILAAHLLDLIRGYEFPATDFPEETSEQFEDSLRRQGKKPRSQFTKQRSRGAQRHELTAPV